MSDLNLPLQVLDEMMALGPDRQWPCEVRLVPLKLVPLDESTWSSRLRAAIARFFSFEPVSQPRSRSSRSLDRALAETKGDIRDETEPD